MVLQLLKVLPELENVKTLEIPTDHIWCLDIELLGTGELRESVILCRDEMVEVPSSRGTANLILKVDNNQYATISIIDDPNKVKTSISSEDSESGRYVGVVAFDCRGCLVKSWRPTGFYTVRTPNGTEFTEVDLQSGEWYDVDPSTNQPVSIMSVKYEIEQFRK